MTEQPNDQPHLYIDEQVEIHEGPRAAALLRERAAREAAAFDAQRGFARVDRARWEEAQRYERRTWMEKARWASTDRNEYHRAHFADFTPLAGRSFGAAIELGCGPFTNMRLILEHCDVRDLHLLDPLLNEYLAHPYCQYRGGRLGGVMKDVPPARALAHPLRLLRNRRNALRVGGLSGRAVQLHASMIEAFVPPAKFDLVVMINVIEHCQDIDAVFGKILEMLAPGGVFVFADKLYDAAEVAKLAEVLFDAGHPLRVDRSVVHGFLAEQFSPLMSAEYAVRQSFRGRETRADELYYIGQRRRGPVS